jgi:hypothetical protein
VRKSERIGEGECPDSGTGEWLAVLPYAEPEDVRERGCAGSPTG